MSNSENRLKALRELREELLGICEDAVKTDDYSTGFERLRRWKERAIKKVTAISKKEGKKLESKRLGIFSYIDPMENLMREAKLNDAFLEAFEIDLREHPEHYSVGLMVRFKERVLPSVFVDQVTSMLRVRKRLFFFRIFIGILIGLSGATSVMVFPSLLSWQWLLSHPKRYGIQILGIIIWFGISWLIVYPKHWRYAILSVIVFAAVTLATILD